VIWSNSFGYKILLLLHILSAVIGYGGYFLNGLFPRATVRSSPEAATAIAAPALQVSTLSQFGMYGVFVFGMGLIGASHKQVEFSQAWVSISMVLWVATIGILHGVILPAQRALKAGEGDRASLAQRISIGGGIMNLAVIVTLVLMVWEPGGKL